MLKNYSHTKRILIFDLNTNKVRGKIVSFRWNIRPMFLHNVYPFRHCKILDVWIKFSKNSSLIADCLASNWFCKSTTRGGKVQIFHFKSTKLLSFKFFFQALNVNEFFSWYLKIELGWLVNSNDIFDKKNIETIKYHFSNFLICF